MLHLLLPSLIWISGRYWAPADDRIHWRALAAPLLLAALLALALILMLHRAPWEGFCISLLISSFVWFVLGDRQNPGLMGILAPWRLPSCF